MRQVDVGVVNSLFTVSNSNTYHQSRAFSSNVASVISVACILQIEKTEKKLILKKSKRLICKHGNDLESLSENAGETERDCDPASKQRLATCRRYRSGEKDNKMFSCIAYAQCQSLQRLGRDSLRASVW